MSANAQGIALMVLAMALFALADAFIKMASFSIPPSQVSVFLFTGSTVVFFCLAAVQRLPLYDPALLSRAMLGRYVSEAVGTIGMITAFALVPLSTVAAVLQASPLIVTMVAAVFLGETVGWRRWLAIAVGFIGVLLIVQPGTGNFQANILWALAGTIGLSLRDVFTRIAPRTLPTTLMSAYTLLFVLPITLIWAVASEGSVMAETPNWAVITAMIVFGCGGYFAVTQAVRLAEMSVVSPFRYTRLVFALLLAVVVFDERPDLIVLLGAAMVLGAGLYAWARERKRMTQSIRP